MLHGLFGAVKMRSGISSGRCDTTHSSARVVRLSDGRGVVVGSEWKRWKEMIECDCNRRWTMLCLPGQALTR